MRTVVQQLQLPKARYDPSKYPNPALQWHYRILQAMALEEDLPEKAEDKTIPRYRQIDKRAGEYVVEWGRELEGCHQVWLKESGNAQVGGKRVADDGGGGGAGGVAGGDGTAAKKLKTDIEPLSDGEMKKAYEKGTVKKLTVAILREWMGGKGIDTRGKKDELVERVEGWFERK